MSEYIVNIDGELEMALAVACAGAGFAREKIVRCRDCKHYTTNIRDEYDNFCWCGFHANYFEPDGFCKWGERRDLPCE